MKQANQGFSPMQFSLPLFDVDDAAKPADEVRTQCAVLPLASASTIFRAELATEQIARIQAAPTAPPALPKPTEIILEADVAVVTYSDDPSSPNYRFRDTGYIGGSRKEAAALTISRARNEGNRVFFSGIDWDDLETNPREAKAMITKSNLFGAVDWEALRTAGLEPGAGFLIDRVYAAIGKEPTESTRQAREDYAIGLQTLRDRLEAVLTAEGVVKVLDNLSTEFHGKVFTQDESDHLDTLRASEDELVSEKRALEVARVKLQNDVQESRQALEEIRWDISKRERRGWSIKPELAAKLEQAKATHAQIDADWGKVMRDTEPRLTEISKAREQNWQQEKDILTVARARNKLENPLHRAWILMGDRFMGVICFRDARKGSPTFRNHVVTARNGKIADWKWAETEVVRAPRVTEESVRFQFKVADQYERVGGRSITVNSTEQLKAMFGLRDVQSGNWVLRDTVSGKFHTEQSAAAFADLADLMGIDDVRIGLAGKVGLAFGARGRGAAGWKGGAPAAHYEPRYRVTNLTKIKGGGALGHEHWHAIDNIVVELVSDATAGETDFVTENPDLLPQGELKESIKALRHAILDGPHRATQTLRYSPRDYDSAKRNLDRTWRPASIAATITAAGNVHDAVQAVEESLGPKPGVTQSKRQKTNYETWRRIAIAHYGGNPAGGEIDVSCGPTMSSYAVEAKKLDGPGKPYYRLELEMSARAFQCWIEDRLAEQGRRNDYLSVFAANEYCVCPITGYPWKPYPEGEERQRINAAFDRVVAALRVAFNA